MCFLKSTPCLLCHSFHQPTIALAMDPLETQELVDKSPCERDPPRTQCSPTPEQEEDHHFSLSSGTRRPKNPLAFLLEPIQWIQMLCSQLDPTFIFGVVLVCGVSQGFARSFFNVATDYYWKDVQKVQPSQVQLYMGLYFIPWVLKPVWGLLTDVFPVRGYKRRPYFVVAGVVGCISVFLVSLLGKLPVAMALSCLIGVTAGIAIADVTIDACIARNSIDFRSLAPDMQSLCGVCSSIGALVGYSSSGLFVHHIGAQLALILLAIPPALIIVLGFVIYEPRSTSPQPQKKNKAMKDLGVAMAGTWETIRRPQAWKPTLYMYLSLALSISTHEGQFYWYTDPKAGPAFSQEFVGIVYAVGAMASIAGVVIYQKALKDCPFRNVLFLAQLLYGMSGMLDIIFVFRWNLFVGIPDYFFLVMGECITRIVMRIRWTPMIVLSTRLCPEGIEGTFFALLMSIDSLGMLSSKWGGGLVLHALHVTRTDFTNLWLAILIRSILSFGTLGLIFLVPNADPSDDLIPPGSLKPNAGTSAEDDGLQLVPAGEKEEA